MFEQISMFEMLEPESRFTSVLRSGSAYENRKVRIYAAALNMDIKQLAVYLKDEYGVGGHSAHYPDGTNGFVDYNGNGIMISEWKKPEKEKHRWLEVAKEVKRLIAHNDYLTAKEWERVREISQDGRMPIPHPRMVYGG